jgi:hypothetical protein
MQDTDRLYIQTGRRVVLRSTGGGERSGADASDPLIMRTLNKNKTNTTIKAVEMQRKITKKVLLQNYLIPVTFTSNGKTPIGPICIKILNFID